MPEAVRFGSMGGDVVVQGGTGPDRARIRRLSRSREQLVSGFIAGRDLRVDSGGLPGRFVDPAGGVRVDRVWSTNVEAAA